MKVLSKVALVFLAVLSLSVASFAADASSLKPPPGASVAIVVFEDLQCPDCARAYPVVWETANNHHVPVMLHDFPLPRHNWSFDAAIWARYFDIKSQQLGNDFRGYIYRNQIQITPDNLRQFVTKFAADNNVQLPFTPDSDGKLKALIQADYSLGQKIGIEHTPTIFVIGRSNVSTPFVEVVDRSQLSQIIEDMQKKAGPATPVKQPATTKKKKVS
jgi:protein-disulfide isomerase